MPRILVGNKLVMKPHLKSDKMVKKEVKNVEKPEATAPVVDTTTAPSIHADKTNAELKAMLDEAGMEYSSSAKKADLLDLVDSIEAESTESV